VQPYVASVDARGETALLYFGGVYSHAIAKGALLEPGAPPTDGLFATEDIAVRPASAAERKVADAVLAWVARRFERAPAYARVDLVEDADGAPILLELELTEPSLFFTQADGAEPRFADAVRALARE
jgi:O-ureido-D-serine cyclo-ligase